MHEHNRSWFSVMSVVVLALILQAGCGKPATVPDAEKEIEFIEVRIHRWYALYGGEIFILRKIGNRWSGKLIGDGNRFSCYYQREVFPRHGWEQFYSSILELGLRDLVGDEPRLDIEDGDWFSVETTIDGKVSQYSISHATWRDSERPKAILRISDLIGTEFETPVFLAQTPGTVGDYLINNCKEFRPPGSPGR